MSIWVEFHGTYKAKHVSLVKIAELVFKNEYIFKVAGNTFTCSFTGDGLHSAKLIDDFMNEVKARDNKAWVSIEVTHLRMFK